MRLSRTIWIVPLLGLPMLLAACGSAVSADALTGTEWQLQELNGRDVLDDVLVTMLLDADDQVSGNGGCNLFFGSWEVDAGRDIAIDVTGSTLMACEWQGQAAMQQETAFLEALGLAKTYDSGANSLRLFNAEGREVAEFSRRDPVSLIGTRWEAFGINNGQNGIIGVLEEAIPSIIFDADDRLSGSGGCNTVVSDFERDGDSISIGPIEATLMACAQAIDEQEALFFQALEQADSYELGHETLYLMAEDGAVLIWFRDTD